MHKHTKLWKNTPRQWQWLSAESQMMGILLVFICTFWIFWNDLVLFLECQQQELFLMLKKILKHMLLGKEWVLNHWNQKPGTSCHLRLSSGISQILLTIPGTCSPSLATHPVLWQKKASDSSCSPPPYPDKAKMQRALFQNQSRPGAGRGTC